jgi:hypothetical protein
MSQRGYGNRRVTLCNSKHIGCSVHWIVIGKLRCRPKFGTLRNIPLGPVWQRCFFSVFGTYHGIKKNYSWNTFSCLYTVKHQSFETVVFQKLRSFYTIEERSLFSQKPLFCENCIITCSGVVVPWFKNTLVWQKPSRQTEPYSSLLSGVWIPLKYALPPDVYCLSCEDISLLEENHVDLGFSNDWWTVISYL